MKYESNVNQFLKWNILGNGNKNNGCSVTCQLNISYYLVSQLFFAFTNAQ